MAQALFKLQRPLGDCDSYEAHSQRPCLYSLIRMHWQHALLDDLSLQLLRDIGREDITMLQDRFPTELDSAVHCFLENRPKYTLYRISQYLCCCLQFGAQSSQPLLDGAEREHSI